MPDLPALSSKLLTISSPPLGENASRPIACAEAAWSPNRAKELEAVLAKKNGFYAFEGALHVFPDSSNGDHIGLSDWNAASSWRSGYGDAADGLLFFAEDLFGVQHCLKNDRVFTFDPETGAVEQLAESLDEWAGKVLADYRMLTGHPLAHAWQARNGTLHIGQRLMPKTPFVCGGAFDIDNLVAIDAVRAMRYRADIARQIRNLPDGSTVQFEIVE